MNIGRALINGLPMGRGGGANPLRDVDAFKGGLQEVFEAEDRLDNEEEEAEVQHRNIAGRMLTHALELPTKSFTKAMRLSGRGLTSDELATRVGSIERHDSLNPFSQVRTALLRKEYKRRATTRKTVEEVVTTGVSSHDCQAAIINWAVENDGLLSKDGAPPVFASEFITEYVHKLGDMTTHSRGSLNITLNRVGSQHTYGEKQSLDMAKVAPYFLRMTGDLPQLAHFRQ